MEVKVIKKLTVCFTGHRKIPQEYYGSIEQQLEKTIVELIEDGYRYFGAGGALGFDTMAAQAVIKLRTKYPIIRLILVLPCAFQTRGWSIADVDEYERIKNSADKVVYVSREYTRDCMFKRNRHLVDNSDVCVCYLTEVRGGTAYTVNYASSKGLRIINIGEFGDFD